ncbi:hypothetical protein UA08_08814 [Talaromyces atroroseus]|uniref:Major facilitator superfamily (MFS) profile domain-containing protein n=1 Tax=Talaromyces atroroseus TaxID=1441469 RepID=A0A225A5T8_TALAT|nr:hypothetical protein UA08_08814 [Talaromyces atroroseus]OKL55821.1 hypothetical protein UA08_08814 [Talaromyces atroroseus]
MSAEKATIKEDDHLQKNESSNLSPEYREYLISRHGTIELDPLPDMTDADPYNWPKWMASQTLSFFKITNLTLVAFHAMMGTFTAAAIMAAFINIAADLNVSVQRASYLTSLVIAILGGAPLFWRPLADRYGRRPIFLLSLICSLVGNIGCANSHSYGTMGLCRAITAFFICPPAAIGSGVVTETFFKNQRARYMGIWTVMVTIGVPIAPLLMGFVAARVGYRWIYYILAITNGVQFILYFFLGNETRYVRETTPNTTGDGLPMTRRGLFQFGRIDRTPLRLNDFYHPLTFAFHPCIFLPAIAYAMVFLWTSIVPTVEIPQLFPVIFGLDTEQNGLQMISIIIGSFIGEQIGGFMSDKWMARRRQQQTKKSGIDNAEEGRSLPLAGEVLVEPEFRLWLAYIGYALAICGFVVFTVQIGKASSSWNVTPLVGAAIGAAGNQIVTTVNITYAVDCYRVEAASVGVFITFVRQTWGFIGPFWFPQMFENVGYNGSAGIGVGLIVAISVIPTVIIQWLGHKWR